MAVVKRVGDTVTVDIIFRNTGNQPLRVYVGASFRKKDTGEWYHLAYAEIYPEFFKPNVQYSVTLPVKTDQASFFLNRPMPAGEYDLYVGIYKRREGGVAGGYITHDRKVIGRMWKAGTGRLYDPLDTKIIRNALILKPKAVPVYRAEIVRVQIF